MSPVDLLETCKLQDGDFFYKTLITISKMFQSSKSFMHDDPLLFAGFFSHHDIIVFYK